MKKSPSPVLITGASGGIGAATAITFARQGHPVALCYHKNQERAVATFNSLLLEGHRAVLCQGDVSDPAQVEKIFCTAEAAFGPVMVLVNNAGYSQQKLFDQLSAEDWDRMFDVHVKGSFLCCRHALPAMIREKRGCIVNISSMWGQVGASCEVHYSAAKAAVIGMTKALAKEMGPSGIRVNCVAPGAIETEMLAGLDLPALQSLREETPLGRLGTPDEIAKTICFLASDAASFFTGQVISPNGGFVL